jgi:allophanate hydrolase subunit 1
VAANAEPKFLDAGEAALVVEFGRTIEPAVHNRVLALDAALTTRKLAGVVELVPTIRSLMIHYDPLVIDRAALIEAVRGAGAGMGLITTFAMPTGWWLVGRTPERMFSPARKETFLAAVGDEIKFEPIDVDTFNALDARAAAGEVVARVTKLA